VAVKIQVMVFWDVMPCSDVEGYHHFGAASIFRVVSYCITAW